MNETARAIVLSAIQAICAARTWQLITAHVRTNHVHLVLHSGICPDVLMGTCKAFATLALRKEGLSPSDRKHWTRGGSARRLVTGRAVANAIRYVLDKQGQRMAVFCAPLR